MVNEDILNYLKSGVASGMTIMELKRNLIQSGWDEKDVLLAISELSKGSIENLKEDEISLPENLEDKDGISLAEEVNFPKEQALTEKKEDEPIVHNVLPVQENIESELLTQNKKSFLSRKNMIIIISSFFVLLLILILAFNLFEVSDKERIDTVDILGGTIVEFTGSKMNIKIGGEVKLFNLNGVDEYIVRYTFGDFNGELYMKENISVDIDNNGINDVDLRLESINSGITKIYMNEI